MRTLIDSGDINPVSIAKVAAEQELGMRRDFAVAPLLEPEAALHWCVPGGN